MPGQGGPSGGAIAEEVEIEGVADGSALDIGSTGIMPTAVSTSASGKACASEMADEHAAPSGATASTMPIARTTDA